MGHRQHFNASQIFENEIDQGWNHAEQPYMPIARGVPESSSIIHSADNIPNQGGHYPPQWGPPPRSSTGHSPSIPNVEFSHYQPIPPVAPVPSRGPFPHQPAVGNPHIFQEHYAHHPSSSNVGGQTIDTVFYNQTEGSCRGPYKRKSPCIPPMFEMGSTSSRYYDVGSSSDIHLPTDPWQEKQNIEPCHSRWEYSSGYGPNNNSLSIGGDGSTMRNVRSRASIDLESHLTRSHLPSNTLHHTFSNQSSDPSNLVDFWGQSSNAPTHEWNSNHVPPAGPHGLISGPDSSFFGHDTNPQNAMNNLLPNNNSVEIGAYNSDVRNHVPQNVGNHLNQSVRGVRSSYGQRSAPTFRASSNNFRPPAPDERQHVGESYPSRHSRALSNLRLRSLDRNVRTCISGDRYRYLSEEASFRDRLAPEGLMVVDHNAVYGSRTLFDQHRDLRLDIDNMSYEELLALGERIGSVSTGLTDGSISKCLTESIYCSSDLSQDEGNCVICLEEYKNMDDVGTLKSCGHDFHVGCIRKWLSMKNVCPICKASATEDSNKEK
ncbi:RING/U-box superfamily protein [Striga hermonthica]|uniref:RING-type E3 ubiquitin transferase n=1 Tax=Striga hermonthica TaxID=68872 RepID=A0A9N7RLK2_STRHE|nr:RING/U-box superfamily protein [Striga hermonthica]